MVPWPCCWASGAGDGGGATDGERGDGDAVRAADAGFCGALERERREWERAGESRGERVRVFGGGRRVAHYNQLSFFPALDSGVADGRAEW